MEPEACAAPTALHLLLIDDLSLRRAGIARLIDECAQEEGTPLRTTGIVPTACTPDGDFALILLSIGGADAASPNVQALLESSRARLPDCPMTVLSDRDDRAGVVAAIRAGARGFIATSIDPVVMVRALTFIAGGGSFFPPDALLASVPELQDDAVDGAEAGVQRLAAGTMLTCRQADVLRLLRRGQSNKYIARELCMRESTVKVHVRQIMRKLGASNRTQAALFARQLDPLVAEVPEHALG